MPSPASSTPRAENTAVWALALPPVERVLCHADRPPALVREWVRRGTVVDVVSRCDLESWLQTESAPGSGRLRCLWEPDRDREYDLALLWDPASAAAVEAWLETLRDMPLRPPEIAIWSRNPWCRAEAPHWSRLDRALRRGGWKLGASHLGLPEPERVRQLVEWSAYEHTSLVQHRRTHRAWKGWLSRQPLFRWWQPVRLRRARLASLPERDTVLQSVSGRATTCGPGGRARLERCLVSPNGVVIAILCRGSGKNTSRSILKLPYALLAEGRVARNASGLEWMAQHEARLGRWQRVAPKLLSRGSSGVWNYTLEEFVGGREAQSWDEASIEGAMHELTGFQETLSLLGGPAARLEASTLDRLIGAPIRAATPLLERAHAKRIQVLGDCLVQELAAMRLPLVPRHGDFKLENVLGDPARPESLRILDWELWSSHGLPLLDLWHLIASRRGRAAGVSMGDAVCRWLLPRDLSSLEMRLVERLARGIDPRYVELSPILYWLDRIGPIAARGGWPRRGWEKSNVVAVLEAIPIEAEVRA